MLSTEWLSAFAPVGVFQREGLWAACGAGVFFQKSPLLWLVTADHVIDSVGPQAVSVLVNQAPGKPVTAVDVGGTLDRHGFTWVRDKTNDLAAAPMPVSPDFQLKAVTPDVCLPLAEVLPSMPCFFVGCPYGLRGFDPQRAAPSSSTA